MTFDTNYNLILRLCALCTYVYIIRLWSPRRGCGNWCGGGDRYRYLGYTGCIERVCFSDPTAHGPRHYRRRTAAVSTATSPRCLLSSSPPDPVPVIRVMDGDGFPFDGVLHSSAFFRLSDIRRALSAFPCQNTKSVHY